MTERVARVAEEFREVLAEEIPKLKDPRVGFVTVTRVSVTPDLRHATVFYTVLGDDSARKATRAGLRSAGGHLRAELGHQVRLKFLPDLEFIEDAGMQDAMRVDEVLKRIRDEDPSDASD